MNNQVFIINGSGGSGKDTFVNLIERNLDTKTLLLNYSSVSKVKQIARFIGWTGEKTEKDRRFLSDLKLLTSEYNDMPLNDMKTRVDGFYNFAPYFNKVIFLHIREGIEIAKAVKEFNAKTVLVKRESVEHITSNMADAGVFDYDYDIIIENNGTLKDLENKAKQFLEDYKSNVLKEKY